MYNTPQKLSIPKCLVNIVLLLFVVIVREITVDELLDSTGPYAMKTIRVKTYRHCLIDERTLKYPFFRLSILFENLCYNCFSIIQK